MLLLLNYSPDPFVVLKLTNGGKATLGTFQWPRQLTWPRRRPREGEGGILTLWNRDLEFMGHWF